MCLQNKIRLCQNRGHFIPSLVFGEVFGVDFLAHTNLLYFLFEKYFYQNASGQLDKQLLKYL